MKAAFFKKELRYCFTPSRLFSFPVTVLLFAFTSAPLTRYTKELFEALMPPESAGLFPDATVDMSFAQYYSNFGQICLLVLAVLVATLIAGEKQLGTAELMLTRAMSRSDFVVSKLVASYIYTTLWFFVGGAIHVLYTKLFFGHLPPNYFYSLLFYWIYCIYLVGMFLFISVLFKKTVPAIIFSIVSLVGTSVIGYIPRIGDFLPTKLTELALEMLQPSFAFETKTLLKVFVPTALLIVAYPVLTVKIFDRQELS